MSGVRTKDGKRKMYRRLAGLLLMAVLLFPLPVTAKEQALIMQSAVAGNEIQLYIRGAESYEEATAQIGMDVAPIVETADTTSVHTIILVDNSLSITEENQEKIQEFITEYVGQKADSEKISVAVFGEEIEYLIEEETDAANIVEVLGQIEYRNQDSFLTDILYDEIMGLQDETEYTRFIVATDGVDNKAIGYTKEELQELLKKKNYPVYALGCVYKDNSAELENLFSIARLTQGRYFLLDDYEEYQEIVRTFGETIGVIGIEIPTECRDGSEKSILLTMETEAGTVEMTSRVSMPFQVKEQEEEETRAESVTVPETDLKETSEESVESENVAEEPVSETAAVMEMESEPVKEEGSVDYLTIGGIILVVLAVAALIVQQVMRKKKSGKKADKESGPTKKEIDAVSDGNVNPESVKEPAMEGDMGATVVLKEEGTVFLDWNRNDYIVVLKDKNDPNKIFRYPIGEGVVIGRKKEAGVQIVLNYDDSVSKRHCVITASNGHFFIEDLHSSNKTYLNGEVVEEKKEFTPGSMIKIGRLEMALDVVKKDIAKVPRG